MYTCVYYSRTTDSPFYGVPEHRSRNVPVDADFLCNRDAMRWDMI